MSRVIPSQLKYISIKEEARYKPVKKESLGGILLLVDTQPSTPRELITLSVPKATAAAATQPTTSPTSNTLAISENEPLPPQPFEYHETD
jgi:26S proteasome regulatory subunit N2